MCENQFGLNLVKFKNTMETVSSEDLKDLQEKLATCWYTSCSERLPSYGCVGGFSLLALAVCILAVAFNRLSMSIVVTPLGQCIGASLGVASYCVYHYFFQTSIKTELFNCIVQPSHAHPILCATAVASGLCCAMLIVKYGGEYLQGEIHLHY